MTLTLSPHMEERVHKVSRMLGRDTDETMLELLGQTLAQYRYARHELGEEEAKEVLAALQESATDFAAGRSISLEDLEEQIQEPRKVRDGAKD